MKKVLLLIIGILFAFVIIELTLQILSFSYSLIKDNQNKNYLKTKNNIVILCLGESTTDGQWPRFLPEELSTEIPDKKFVVIDKGVRATNTSVILKNLPQYIQEYNPDIIISMMGINDGSSDVIKLKQFYFKTSKLIYLIKQHLLSKKIQQDKLLSKFDFGFDLSIKCYNENRYDEGIKILTKMLEDFPEESIKIIKMLARMYVNRAYVKGYDTKEGVKDIKKAEEYVLFAIEKDKYFDINLTLFVLSKAENIDKLKELFPIDDIEKFKEIYAKDPWGFISHVKCLMDLKMYDLVKVIDYVSYDNSNINEDVVYKDRIIGSNASSLIGENNFKQAEKYFKIQKQILLNNHLRITVDNYKKLHNICKSNNIKLMAMQYPLRPVEALKIIFDDKSDVSFIDNESLFKNILKEKKMNEIFVDLFAGDFGHCTDFGNKIIAKNVAKSVKKILN